MELLNAIAQLSHEKCKGLIIDLRDNPGGWVNDAQSIADIFLDKGTLCYLQYKNGERYYYRTKDGKVEMPLVILVNENSASSSEILTGALRDRANATVVGKKTYGKGIVQSVVPLSTVLECRLPLRSTTRPTATRCTSRASRRTWKWTETTACTSWVT